jgi:type IV fimbrial biogenesis protein FimT
MHNHQGISLIEILVTIAIGIILVSAGLPSMTSWVNASQMNSRASSLATVLRAARGEALTRNNTVTVSTDTSGDWASLVSVYMDTTGANDPYSEADGDEFIREVDLSSALVSIKGNATADNYISFSGDGRLDEGGQTVTIEICKGSDGTYDTTTGQTISINIVGRVSVSEGVTDCTP